MTKYIFSLLFFFALTSDASAYFGMGPLIPMIGSAFILLFTLGVALFGIAAYPLKMMLTKKKAEKEKKAKAKTTSKKKTTPKKTTATKAKAKPKTKKK